METVVDHAMAELPETVRESLALVDYMIVDDAAAANRELPLWIKETARASKRDRGSELADMTFEPFPDDFKGRFLGWPLLFDEEDDSGEELSQDPPEGTIFFCAGNLDSEQEIGRTLAHEIGHALGLSEEEVADLGLE